MTAGLTAPEPAASQRELDALGRRVEAMDRDGTRGVGVIQAQLVELARDLSKLEGAQASHEQLHRTEAADRDRDRRSGVRWRISASIGAAAALAAVLGFLAEIAGRLH